MPNPHNIAPHYCCEQLLSHLHNYETPQIRTSVRPTLRAPTAPPGVVTHCSRSGRLIRSFHCPRASHFAACRRLEARSATSSPPSTTGGQTATAPAQTLPPRPDFLACRTAPAQEVRLMTFSGFETSRPRMSAPALAPSTHHRLRPVHRPSLLLTNPGFSPYGQHMTPTNRPGHGNAHLHFPLISALCCSFLMPFTKQRLQPQAPRTSCGCSAPPDVPEARPCRSCS